MKIIAFTLTFFVSLLTTLSCGAQAPGDASVELANTLRLYVHPIDRDLWTFRYESRDAFQPKNVADLQQRLGPWAERFWNVNVVQGADTGPGVYVATDPAATAAFGSAEPRLFAIKLRAGTNILVGDQYRTPPDVLQHAQALSTRLGCGSSSTSMDSDIGHLIGFFRMNSNVECRQAAIDALKVLEVKAVSYSFNSVPLTGCRTTGTAFSIISASAISMSELNRYSDAGNIEGQPEVSPYVHLLFLEAKDDHYSQTLLWSLDVRTRYQSAYGFFAKTPMVGNGQYGSWKAAHIYKCGPHWNGESADSESVRGSELRRGSNPKVKELLIRMSLVYRDKFRSLTGMMPGSSTNFDPVNLAILKQRYPQDRDTLLKIFTAQVPSLSGDGNKDEDDYMAILQDCLKIYETQAPSDIMKGRCRVER